LDGQAVATVTANDAQVVHVWVIDGEADPLFEDICTMTEHLADRAGGTLERISGGDGLPTGQQHYFGRLEGQQALVNLRQEVGVHRGQSVPSQSTSGRVATTLVGVELLPSPVAARSDRPDGPVRKTYNYINRSVTIHTTGAQLRLEAALRGET